MRQIKFRSKRIDNSDWITGSLICSHGRTFIAFNPYNPANDFEYYEVNHETVGQFTGLHDKNGKEIYEGDMLKSKYGDIFKASYSGKFFCHKPIGMDGINRSLATNDPSDLEIIGNIHEKEPA